MWFLSENSLHFDRNSTTEKSATYASWHTGGDFVDLPRASGILMHPSSLPGPFGIGDLGPAAYRFVDFLVRTGQRWWQILPLGPTGYGNSPYMCFSAFGGNG